MSSTKTSKTAGEARTDDSTPSGDATPVIAVNDELPNTEAPTEAAPVSAEEIPRMSELQGIRYTGMADVKSFTAADLEAISGEPAKMDLQWSADNGFVVPTKEFSAATRDALLALADFTAE